MSGAGAGAIIVSLTASSRNSSPTSAAGRPGGNAAEDSIDTVTYEMSFEMRTSPRLSMAAKGRFHGVPPHSMGKLR